MIREEREQEENSGFEQNFNKMKKYSEKINETEQTSEDNVKDDLLKRIADRAQNNIMIREFSDDRESELDLSAFLEILKDDLKMYNVTKA